MPLDESREAPSPAARVACRHPLPQAGAGVESAVSSAGAALGLQHLMLQSNPCPIRGSSAASQASSSASTRSAAGSLAGPVLAAAVVFDRRAAAPPGAPHRRFQAPGATRSVRQSSPCCRQHARFAIGERQRRGDRQPQHPEGRASRHAPRRRRARTAARPSSSSTATATPELAFPTRCIVGGDGHLPFHRRRLHRRQGHPRPRHDGAGSDAIPAMAGSATRAMARPSTGRRCAGLGVTPAASPHI